MERPAGLRAARLRGRDHPGVGEVDCVAEGPAAIALSRGGAEKTYPHTDPNEDAAVFALGAAGCLAGVADAHGGCVASEVALDFLLERRAGPWTGAEAPDPAAWRDAALEALWEAHRAVLRAAQRPERQGSRTTLALAVMRPAEGRVLYASLGDSHVFRVGAEEAADLAAVGHPCPPRYFLGSESLRPEELAAEAVVGSLPAAGVRALVLATDGVSERGVGLAHPDREVLELARAASEGAGGSPALETARGLAERANAAHRRNPSGDNVAVAALWLGRPTGPPAAPPRARRGPGRR